MMDGIPEHSHPRSWTEAREILKSEIRSFRHDFEQAGKATLKTSIETTRISVIIQSLAVEYYDIIVGLLISISVLIVGILNERKDNAKGLEIVMAGALGIIVSSASLFGTYRRNMACQTNRHNDLIQGMDEYLRVGEINQESNGGNGGLMSSSECCHHSGIRSEESKDYDSSIISSTNGDYYRVYRKNGDQNEKGRWHRIPNVLLVEGDLIALQVGDIAPANVCSHHNTRIHVKAGEKVNLAHDSSLLSSLPSGKSSFLAKNIASNSKQLLSLSKHMQLFVILETPLPSILKKIIADEDEHDLPEFTRLPSVIKKLKHVRKLLFFLGMLSFVVSFVILVVRFGKDVFSHSTGIGMYLMFIPLLSAQTLLPIISPLFIYCLEIIGVARILSTIHPLIGNDIQTTCDGNFDSSHHRQQLMKAYCVKVACARFIPTLNTRQYSKRAEVLPRFIPYSESSVYKNEIVGNGTMLQAIPSSDAYLLEKLGNITALVLTDDELVCEDYSTPQQLLVPSSKGLKLLDMHPTFLAENVADIDDSSSDHSHADSDYSDTSNDLITSHGFSERATKSLKRLRRKLLLAHRWIDNLKDRNASEQNLLRNKSVGNDICFEDPLWWKLLPSLKAIGVACLLIHQDSNKEVQDDNDQNDCEDDELHGALSTLIPNICRVQKRNQLLSLSKCIGFKNNYLDSFTETRRMHIVSTQLLQGRLTVDAHALGLEEARGCGLLRPDSTSVIGFDGRTRASQLFTVGDADVVLDLCSELWQGESSIISPLSPIDRQTIMEMNKDWNLADLDVVVFSYAPVPHHAHKIFMGSECAETAILVDNRKETFEAPSKDCNQDLGWGLVKNQIFLGMLGSSIRPRRETESLLEQCNSAGIRFVFFSPRNMRRTKELASQMGIDVSWNSAISLRELNDGEVDFYSPTWDKKAKLPHGVQEVKTHLDEVDNVPLLVSLFTDVTCETSKAMLRIFREYGDTVSVVGLVSSTIQGLDIKKSADLAIGVNLISVEMAENNCPYCHNFASAMTREDLQLVRCISSNVCAFQVEGPKAMMKLAEIVGAGRESLEAIYSGALFVLTGCVSLALVLVFAPCSVAVCIPFIPPLESMILLVFFLPVLGFSLAFSDVYEDAIKRTPAKNESNDVFLPYEKRHIYIHNAVRSIFPAFGASFLYLIALGDLLLNFEVAIIDECGSAKTWSSAILCTNIREYDGGIRSSASALVLSELALCFVVCSASYVNRSKPLHPTIFKNNYIWIIASAICLILVVLYLSLSVPLKHLEALPWYFFLYKILWPFICLTINEVMKKREIKDEVRADTFRKLEFETRLGMWSPK